MAEKTRLKASQRHRVRSEALFGLAEFAFLLRGGGGKHRFLAVGDVIPRNLKKEIAERKKTKQKTKIRQLTSRQTGKKTEEIPR